MAQLTVTGLWGSIAKRTETVIKNPSRKLFLHWNLKLITTRILEAMSCPIGAKSAQILVIRTTGRRVVTQQEGEFITILVMAPLQMQPREEAEDEGAARVGVLVGAEVVGIISLEIRLRIEEAVLEVPLRQDYNQTLYSIIMTAVMNRYHHPLSNIFIINKLGRLPPASRCQAGLKTIRLGSIIAVALRILIFTTSSNNSKPHSHSRDLRDQRGGSKWWYHRGCNNSNNSRIIVVVIDQNVTLHYASAQSLNLEHLMLSHRPLQPTTNLLVT